MKKSRRALKKRLSFHNSLTGKFAEIVATLEYIVQQFFHFSSMNLKVHRLEYHNEDSSEDAAIVGCDRQIVHIRVNIGEYGDR